MKKNSLVALLLLVITVTFAQNAKRPEQDSPTKDSVGNASSLRFSQLYFGSGLQMPSSKATNGSSNVLDGIDLNIGYYHPIWAWGKSMSTLGFNAELRAEPKATGFRGGAGLQMNLRLGNFTLSPILNAGYLNTSPKSFTTSETFYHNGSEYRYDLTQKENRVSGLGVLPKLRVAYNITPIIGIWLEGNYTIGPKTKIETTSFVLDPSLPSDPLPVTTQKETSYSVLGVNSGIFLNIGKDNKKEIPKYKINPISDATPSMGSILTPLANELTSPTDDLPPTDITPADGKILTESEAKEPVTFRWMPIIPKPQQKVNYRLRIWQVGEGQTVNSAVKGNAPIVEKEVTDQTEFIKTNLLDDIKLINGQAQLAWNVQASTEQVGIIGESKVTAFAVLANCNATLKIDSIVCTDRRDRSGNIIYKTYMKVTNSGTRPLNFNNAINTTTNPFIVSNTYNPKYVLNTNATSFTSTTTPPIVSAGTTLPFNAEIGVPSTATKLILTFSLYDNTLYNTAVCNPTDSLLMPTCICNDCKLLKFNVLNPAFSLTNSATGIYSATGSFSITGSPIYGVEVQVLSSSYAATPPSCSNGVTSVENSGVIHLANTSINNVNPVFMVNETASGSLSGTNNGVAKNISIKSTSALPSAIPFKINFGLPTALPGLTATCCVLKHKVCVRVRAYLDRDMCNSCVFTTCFNN